MNQSTVAASDESRLTTGPSRSHESGVDAEALARCEHLIETGRSFGLVSGPAGAGKSQLLRRLATQSVAPADPPPILLDATHADGESLLADLGDALAAGPPGATSANRWRLLRDRLDGLATCGHRQLLLVDHLDAAQAGVCAMIARLLRSGADAAGLTIITAARCPLTPAIVELQQDFGWLRIEVAAFNDQQARAAVRRRLGQSGRHHHALDAVAVGELFELAHGNPRQVQHLLDVTLLAAEAEGEEAIRAPLVRAAARELCGAPA